MPVAAMVPFACGLAFPAGASPLQAETELPMMPLAAHALKAGGSLPIDGGFQIEFQGHTEPRLVRARDRFLAHLSRETGILHWPIFGLTRVTDQPTAPGTGNLSMRAQDEPSNEGRNGNATFWFGITASI